MTDVEIDALLYAATCPGLSGEIARAQLHDLLRLVQLTPVGDAVVAPLQWKEEEVLKGKD